jgi:ketopantoate reductase
LNGYLADSAAAIGLAAPLNKKLAQMIAEIEAGQRSMRATNLKELPL